MLRCVVTRDRKIARCTELRKYVRSVRAADPVPRSVRRPEHCNIIESVAVIVSDNRLVTVALGVFLQQSPNTQPDWTGLMAASTLSVLPVLVLLIFMGKRLVQSLNFTGSK